MANTLNSLLRILALLLGLSAWPATVFAHRLDEYLQATLVTIEPGQVRLQINFTPGVAVAEKVLALIDRNRDAVISPKEADTYSQSLKHDLVLQLDRRTVEPNLISSRFPTPKELRTGWGIIQMEFTATIGPLARGHHRLTLKNRHLRSLSVYLFNAAPPSSGSTHIIRQTRNRTQSTGEIEFTID